MVEFLSVALYLPIWAMGTCPKVARRPEAVAGMMAIPLEPEAEAALYLDKP